MIRGSESRRKSRRDKQIELMVPTYGQVVGSVADPDQDPVGTPLSLILIRDWMLDLAIKICIIGCKFKLHTFIRS